MEYDFEKLKKLMREYAITTVNLLWRENDLIYHSRNPFAYGVVAEYLRDTKKKTSGLIEILQGFDMNVPSKLYVEFIDKVNSSVKISGESRIIRENK